jgi:hypothetical protein
MPPPCAGRTPRASRDTRAAARGGRAGTGVEEGAMRFWSREGPAAATPAPAEARQTRQALPDVTGPLTAREAFALVGPAALAQDRRARLYLITCGEGAGSDGRAERWEFLFHLPGLAARARFMVGRAEDADAADASPALVAQVTPFVAPGSPLAEMISRGAVSPAQAQTLWDREMAERPPLPTPFRDSPQAVLALGLLGADFSPGAQRVILEARVAPHGKPVWQAILPNETLETGFRP